MWGPSSLLEKHLSFRGVHGAPTFVFGRANFRSLGRIFVPEGFRFCLCGLKILVLSVNFRPWLVKGRGTFPAQIFVGIGGCHIEPHRGLLLDLLRRFSTISWLHF